MPAFILAALVLLTVPLAAPSSPANPHVVRFDSDTTTLVGLLAVPDQAPPHPAIVLLHGSERGRRDGPFFAHVRERMIRAGFAVLTWDKRGVGESEGTYSETPSLEVPFADAAAAIAYLRSRSDIAPLRIGVFGISQGGWVASLVASRDTLLAFAIAVSEPGVPSLEQSAYHRAREHLEAGMSGAAADSMTSARLLLFRYWHGDVSRASVDSAWTLARASSWLARAASSDDLFSRIGMLRTVPPPERMPADFMRAVREHFFFDPIPVAGRLRIPVLHLFGAADRHLPVALSVSALRRAYSESGHPDATVTVAQGAGHGMQQVDGDAECLRCPPGQPWVYAPGWADSAASWARERSIRAARR